MRLPSFGVPGYTKYHNTKVEIDGISFDSKKEGKVYDDLKILKKVGEIKDFKMQVPFELIPKQMEGKKVVERAVKYVADFVIYHTDGSKTVVDCKGMQTPVYKLKRKLMRWVHKVKIMEV